MVTATQRARAEKAITNLYLATGHTTAPTQFAWFSSPYALFRHLGPGQAGELEGVGRHHVGRRHHPLGDRVGMFCSPSQQLRPQVAALNAVLVAATNALGLPMPFSAVMCPKYEDEHPYADIARYCGIFRISLNPYKCLVSEPHVALHTDGAGLPHNTTGPAITYPDGWGVYAVRGTVVPPEWITEPETLTPSTALYHENMEQRRAACELLGWERILRELDASTIDADPDPEVGTLLEAELPDVGRARFLRVRCPTGRWFCLQVPPEMQTALEANTWSYGLDGNTYRKLEGRT